MPSLHTDTWSSVLHRIKKAVGEQRFGLWFQNMRPIEGAEGQLVLGVPNLFVQEWLESHFLDVLRQCLTEELGAAPTVRFTIDPSLFRASRERDLNAGAELVADAAAPQQAPRETREPSLRPDFTLDNFIVGPCNKLVHACALEIIESPACNLHPLFIHSLSGLGKTHLLQAVWRAIQERGDGRKAEYLSAETFANQFIYAVRSNRLDAFRHRYRGVDVLLLDDVHFLNNKPGVQEELLHTFDALDTRKRHLVLASDVHPKMLAQMKENLVNRFASGMVVRMTAPDFGTRVNILKAKLRQQRRRVPDEVIRYIARGFEGSVRDLTGAATTVLAYAALTGAKIDIALAREALSRLGPADMAVSSDLGTVEKAVARHFGVDAKTLRSRRQTRATRLPRQVCMALARECTSLSCREVAAHFNAANHSSIVFACKRVAEARRKDAHLNELVAAIAAEIKKT